MAKQEAEGSIKILSVEIFYETSEETNKRNVFSYKTVSKGGKGLDPP